MRWVVGAAVALLVAAALVGAALVRAPFGEGRTTLLAARISGPKVDCVQTRVVRLDPRSLAEIDTQAVRLRGAFEQPVYSPDRRTAALGGNNGTLALIDVDDLALKKEVRVAPPGHDVRVVAWAAPNRVVAASMTARARTPYATRVVMVDSTAPRIVSESRLPARDAAGSTATQSGRVAFLVVGRAGLTQPSMLVVEPDGRMRTIALRRLRTGWDRKDARHFPGFAVDPAGERAFVLGEGQPVAIVDLRTLRVRYKRVNAMRLRPMTVRHPKGVDPGIDRVRNAQWLGDDGIAISGSDGYVSYFNPTPWQSKSYTPAGLAILDTHTWRMRVLDQRPSSFAWLGGRLLAYGRTFQSPSREVPDETLIAFDANGRQAYKVRGDRSTYWETFDGRIFLWKMSPQAEVRAARDGRVVGHIPAQRLRGMGPC